MNIFKMVLQVFILISFLASISFAQETKTIKDLEQQAKSIKNGKKFEISYDKFENVSAVKHKGFDILTFGDRMKAGYPPPRLFFGTGFFFDGESFSQTPKEFYVYFWYQGGDWAFLKGSKLILIIDDERLQLEGGLIDTDVKKTRVSELLGFAISKNQIEKIVNAKKVEFKIGNYVRDFKPEYFEMFSIVLKLADPSAKQS